MLAIISSLSTHAQAVNTEVNKDNETVTVLEKITILGEKKNRSLQETASSINFFSEDDISNMGLFDSNSLLEKIPNITTTTNDNELPAVRGVSGTGPASGSAAFLAGSRPRLNYMVDGRTLGFNESTFQIASLWDVQQVEFYRGPQSTLQGRNSIAGAMAIHTANPTDDWQVKARAITGNNDKKIASLALSGPLIEDILSFRLSGDYQDKKSWLDYEAFENDSDPKEYRSETYRGKLLFTPNDDINIQLDIGHTFGKRPQSERLVAPYEDEVPYNINMPTFESTNDYSIVDVDWSINDNVSVEVNVSHTNFETQRHELAGAGNVDIDGSETVIQPLIRMQTTDETLSGFIGLYLFNSEQDEFIDLITGGTFDDKTENQSIYGEVTWKVSEQLDVILGGRYEHEERFREGDVANLFFVNYDETYSEFLPKATVAYHINDWTIGGTVGRGYNAGGAGIAFTYPFPEYTYDAEFVTSAETFLRGSVLDDSLSISANLFYNTYDDMQLPYYITDSIAVIDNAEKASTYGLEATFDYKLSSNATTFLNVGLLKTKLDEYSSEIDGKEYQGNELARAPAFSVDLGADIEIIDNLTVTGNIRYSGSYYSDDLNSARGKIAPYTLINMQLAYTYENSRWFIKADNLLDTDDIYFIYVGATEATDGGSRLRRNISAGVELSF